MAEKFVGTWNYDKSENFDDYLKELGLLTRKTVAALKPTQEISISGDTITIKTTSRKVHEVNFKLGEPFEDTTADGRTLKTTYTIEGDNLVAEQVPVKDGDAGGRITRSITPDGMTMTLEVKGVVCKRYFKRA